MKSVKKYFLFFFLFFMGIISFIFFYKSYKTKSVYTASDYIHIGEHFGKKRDLKRAIGFYEKALHLEKNNLDALVLLASACFNTGQYENSVDYFKKAYNLSPNSKEFLYQMGRIFYLKLHNLEDAIWAMEEYKKFDKNSVNAYITLHDCYAKLGDFKKALKNQQERYDLLISQGLVGPLEKEWDGSEVKNKVILLRDNVGIGDVFCWLRFAKKLKQQGAIVVLEVRKFLIPILAKSGCIDYLIPKGAKLPKFDYQMTIGKMPDLLTKIEGDLKTEIPYMNADKKLIKIWGEKLAQDKKFKIGVCWDPFAYKDAKGVLRENKRAMPLSFLLPLSKLKNVSLYSLQRVNGTEQLESVGRDFNIKIFSKDFDKTNGSFSDTAAVMKNLDLVITVDTSVAHLAGALGVPVWMMLPLVCDWRWLSDEHTTILYPTMRLFRQKILGDWEHVINDVYYELSKIVR